MSFLFLPIVGVQILWFRRKKIVDDDKSPFVRKNPPPAKLCDSEIPFVRLFESPFKEFPPPAKLCDSESPAKSYEIWVNWTSVSKWAGWAVSSRLFANSFYNWRVFGSWRYHWFLADFKANTAVQERLLSVKSEIKNYNEFLMPLKRKKLLMGPFVSSKPPPTGSCMCRNPCICVRSKFKRNQCEDSYTIWGHLGTVSGDVSSFTLPQNPLHPYCELFIEYLREKPFLFRLGGAKDCDVQPLIRILEAFLETDNDSFQINVATICEFVKQLDENKKLSDNSALWILAERLVQIGITTQNTNSLTHMDNNSKSMEDLLQIADKIINAELAIAPNAKMACVFSILYRTYSLTLYKMKKQENFKGFSDSQKELLKTSAQKYCEYDFGRNFIKWMQKTDSFYKHFFELICSRHYVPQRFTP